MSTVKVDTIKTTAGVEVYTAKAWVNFNGTGTVAIRAAGNVSSITDNGTGDYTVNFTTAMPDVNYSYAFSGGGAVSSGTMVYQAVTQLTSSLRYNLAYPGTLQDASTQCVEIFR